MSNPSQLSNGVSVSEVDQLAVRLQELGLKSPTSICIVPSNYASAITFGDLFVPPSAADLRPLFREAGVSLETISPDGEGFLYRDDRDSTLIMPVIFFGMSYWSGNLDAITVALDVITNYVTDFFRGKAGNKNVRCSVLVETDTKKTVRRIEYDGPPESFDKLVDAIKIAVK